METDKLIIWSIESEVDEIWSFVWSKENKQWIWIAMDVRSRQALSFSKKLKNHIGAIKYFICHYNYQRALHV